MPGNPFSSPTGAPVSFVAVTPGNTTLLGGFQYLYVAVAGNLELQGVDDAASTGAFAVLAGALIPFGAGYVRSLTTATLVGLK